MTVLPLFLLLLVEVVFRFGGGGVVFCFLFYIEKSVPNRFQKIRFRTTFAGSEPLEPPQAVTLHCFNLFQAHF